MAKKSKRNSSYSSSRRDTYTRITRRSLPRRNYTAIQDYRRFHPDGSHQPFRDTYGGTLTPRRRVYTTHSTPLFQGRGRRPVFTPVQNINSSVHLPKRAIICARRSIRKEVLFAKNKTGRTGQKKPHFNPNSNLRCN